MGFSPMWPRQVATPPGHAGIFRLEHHGSTWGHPAVTDLGHGCRKSVPCSAAIDGPHGHPREPVDNPLARNHGSDGWGFESLRAR